MHSIKRLSSASRREQKIKSRQRNYSRVVMLQGCYCVLRTHMLIAAHGNGDPVSSFGSYHVVDYRGSRLGLSPSSTAADQSTGICLKLDPDLDPTHFKIGWNDGSFVLADCNSKGGTFHRPTSLWDETGPGVMLERGNCVEIGSSLSLIVSGVGQTPSYTAESASSAGTASLLIHEKGTSNCLMLMPDSAYTIGTHEKCDLRVVSYAFPCDDVLAIISYVDGDFYIREASHHANYSAERLCFLRVNAPVKLGVGHCIKAGGIMCWVDIYFEERSPLKLRQPERITDCLVMRNAFVVEEPNFNRRETMEDRHVLIHRFGGVENILFFAIYDGHCNDMVSDFVSTAFHQNLLRCLGVADPHEVKCTGSHSASTSKAEEATFEAGKTPAASIEAVHDVLKASNHLIASPIEPYIDESPFDNARISAISAFQRAFSITNEQVRGLPDEGGQYGGTTATTGLLWLDAFTGKRWLVTANVGDSRAIICRNGKAIEITEGHRASSPSENERVTAQYGPQIQDERLKGLEVTRAFGDLALTQFGLSCKPYLHKMELNVADELLVVACDGVWDVLDSQEAVDLIKNDSDSQVMCMKIIELALARETTDNLTVMAIKL